MIKVWRKATPVACLILYFREDTRRGHDGFNEHIPNAVARPPARGSKDFADHVGHDREQASRVATRNSIEFSVPFASNSSRK